LTLDPAPAFVATKAAAASSATELCSYTYLTDRGVAEGLWNSAMTKSYDYNQQMDVRYAHQELIDIEEIVDECTDKWFNQTLTIINDSVARIGIVEGDYHWHSHEHDDEFFFVLSGKLLIDLEDQTIELNPNQGVTISKGVRHRPRAPEKTVMLMVETASIDPIGDDCQ
jgi:mannose-6-phosphate isomerase-like protein (cupin superfamily)